VKKAIQPSGDRRKARLGRLLLEEMKLRQCPRNKNPCRKIRSILVITGDHMHTYKINYTAETVESDVTLTVDHMATHLQIVEAVARHRYPDKAKEISDVLNKIDRTELENYLRLMAKWHISSISYTIDDEFEEHQL
jgi:hypothetical protein